MFLQLMRNKQEEILVGIMGPVLFYHHCLIEVPLFHLAKKAGRYHSTHSQASGQIYDLDVFERRVRQMFVAD